MNRKNLMVAFLAAFLLSPASSWAYEQTADPVVSGQLDEGYRVLAVPAAAQHIRYTVYRGDYIKFRFERKGKDVLLKIPALAISQELPSAFTEAPYFKMKAAGIYDFSLGEMKGRLAVIEYRQPNYRELTAPEAAVIIANEDPLVLDVRTRAEYDRGHLADAVLIPVQELDRRIVELRAYKQRDILVYCATGNRSTVASKILIDSGFERVLNMRHGIAEWSKFYKLAR